MSAENLTAPARIEGSRNFTIVASRYNARFVTSMIEQARAELTTLCSEPEIRIFEVPGAFEIPLAVQEALSAGRTDAVLALGVIIEGATRHASLIARSVTDALMRLALEHRTPVIHEVLCVADEAQAAERCMDGEMNRGAEAARAAIFAVSTLEAIRPQI